MLNKEYFYNEKEAFKYIESIIWKDGAKCPHCGSKERVYRLEGKSTREGLYKCGECRKQFTVRVGTIFENSRIPLCKWLQAYNFIISDIKKFKKPPKYFLNNTNIFINNQPAITELSKLLHISYVSAWKLFYKIKSTLVDFEINVLEEWRIFEIESLPKDRERVSEVLFCQYFNYYEELKGYWCPKLKQRQIPKIKIDALINDMANQTNCRTVLREKEMPGIKKALELLGIKRNS